jgi:hypothetical protein
MPAESMIGNKMESDLVLVRACCMKCGAYGVCAIGRAYDGRTIYVGVDCGCLEGDVGRMKKLREEGSVHARYA